jgi:hypothetical protein
MGRLICFHRRATSTLSIPTHQPSIRSLPASGTGIRAPVFLPISHHLMLLSQASSNKLNYLIALAGLNVTSVRDLTIGYDSTKPPSYKPALPLSSGHMVQFRAENPTDGTRITLTTRTSGTEPNIWRYLEGSGSDRVKVAELLPKVVHELGHDWMEAEKNRLGMP